jgi:hypothetical protein
MSFLLLEKDFEKGQYRYQQIKRDDKRAIYSQTYKPANKIVGYEVFRIRIGNEFTFPGTTTVCPSKEQYPSNESFGGCAWSYCTLKAAGKKYDELLNFQPKTKRERKKVV